MSNNKKIFAQPPLKYTGLRVTEPKKVSGGFEAVVSATKHIVGEVGIVEGTKAMLKINQFDGFDCPGCAWPDPDKERAQVEFCENGAKAVAEEATTKKVDAKFFKKHSISKLSTWSDYEIGRSGRLVEPMVVKPGSDHYEPISWQAAFKLIGEQLNKLDSPDEAIFYTSGRTSNEAAFLYQLFVRQYGTNNLPDCSNMCHESSGAGLSETVGIGKGSVKLDDFYKAEVIMIIGQNPGTNHPRMLTALQEAKKNGAKIITVNPLSETGLSRFKHPQKPMDMLGSGTMLTDIFLQVRINGDIPLLKAILKLLLDHENESPGSVFDHEFIQSKTEGFEDFLADLSRYDIDDLVEQSGISVREINKAVSLLAEKNKVIICWAMGLTQHRNAVDNIREVVNLLLLKGSIGKPGAGTCPVRGHSNVQGDRTMGIWEKLKPAFGEKLKQEFDFEPPKKEGYDVVAAIEAMKNGSAKVFCSMGGNFLSATPDTELTARALQQCEMTVQVSTKLNRSHLIHGKTALILPCLGRTEKDEQGGKIQFVTVENSTGVVHQSRGGKAPVSVDLLSEPKIVAGLANATLPKSKVDWDGLTDNYDLIRDAIERTIPGFENYNERVRKPGGFYLPNGAREGDFKTKTQKANFTINKLPEHRLKPDEYLMMTVRSHDQYNTTIYGLHDRYRGIFNERRVVMMNPEDMREAGIEQKDEVDLVSNYDGVERKAESFIAIEYDIPKRCVATYFPEANAVIPYNHYAHTSKTPISKSVVVKLLKN
ncbi:MAG: FdhF/YdeP family oxidoreductase [Bacteroidota bacterium]